MKKLIMLSALLLAACDQLPSDKNQSSKSDTTENSGKEAAFSNRWYTPSQLDSGAKTYQQYCLQCHNENAKGIVNWKQTRPDGNYPPPPLNGSAHAWHHDIGTLTRTIENGGVALGGVMPGFSGKLSAAEIRAVIAYFQSFWSDEIYRAWIENGGLE